MSVTVSSSENTTSSDLYYQIQHFYATQLHYLDSGEIDKWVMTFTQDGVFAMNSQPQPARGRAAIGKAAGKAAEDLARRGVVQRHWLGMLALDPHPDGTVRTRSYALVTETPRGGHAALKLSAVCEDVLVQGDMGWLVRERQVRRDGLR
jgi:hypothetical protein